MPSGFWWVLGAGLGGIILAITAITRWQTQNRIRRRIARLDDDSLSPMLISRQPVRRFYRRYYWMPWILGLTVAVGLYLAVDLSAPYSLLPGVLIGLFGTELERLRIRKLEARIESQLADAIDLMVGSLQAGAGVMAAMENATIESRWPLQEQFAEVLGRIRLGDDPQTVLRALARRVPLETFVLFTTALSVHWEVGGSLAPTLATVGRAIRDRIELARRIGSLTAQARASVAAVLFATYFIALIIWRNNPERMMTFLKSEIGSWLVGFAILMQAIGIVWSATISRIRY